MRQLGSATCPRLAEASGLSLVTVHKAVRRLCATRELRESGQRTTRGGRPSPVYECNPLHACRVQLNIHRQAAVFCVELEVQDLLGRTLVRKENIFASLAAESLDGMLDDALSHQRVECITLGFTPAHAARDDIRAHLQQRYSCPASCTTPAEALADTREGVATLYLRRGETPVCCMSRYGRLIPTGRLDLLPLPSDWEKLDYEDHTLVEEMISRLLHILTCTLAPSRIVLHADFWTPRLTERIRFNTSAKLRPLPSPHLMMCDIRADSGVLTPLAGR